jgi:hypothetical protein
MKSPLDRRRFSQFIFGAFAAFAASEALAAGAAPTAAAASAADDAMIEFDSVYIPPLFLTGSAPKSAEGPARAKAALARLQASWPTLRTRLLAAWPGDAGWRGTLDAVQRHIAESDRLAARGVWPEAHEALEHVRAAMKKAREARGMVYVLDRFVAFHDPMEHLAEAGAKWDPRALGAAQRAEIEAHFVQARARWRELETLNLDARALRLTPVREAQLRQAMADESAALTALSMALRGDDAAALLKAAAATKPPFVRAYTAFGLAEGESPGAAAAPSLPGTPLAAAGPGCKRYGAGYECRHAIEPPPHGPRHGMGRAWPSGPGASASPRGPERRAQRQPPQGD